TGRRLHAICYRDLSSDVCSSDLHCDWSVYLSAYRVCIPRRGNNLAAVSADGVIRHLLWCVRRPTGTTFRIDPDDLRHADHLAVGDRKSVVYGKTVVLCGRTAAWR